MRKPAFCLGENKDADHLCSNCAADQRLCFRYIDTTIPLLSKFEISSFKPASVTVQPGLCRTWSETPKTGFLTTRLKSNQALPCRIKESNSNQFGYTLGTHWLHMLHVSLCEWHHEKTCCLHMQKQRLRSAAWYLHSWSAPLFSLHR